MAGQPRPLFPGATPARKDWGIWFVDLRVTRVLLARFQTHSFDLLTGLSAEPSLRPFWHRVLREAGAGQPFTFYLQRAFKFSSQFQASPRQSRLYRSNIDLQRRGNLFIGQAFDVA